MKYFMAALLAAFCCGCMSNRDYQGSPSSSSSEEMGTSSSQREHMIPNHISDNVKNPSSNWNTP
jgi:hypothetical protein